MRSPSVKHVTCTPVEDHVYQVEKRGNIDDANIILDRGVRGYRGAERINFH